MSSQRSLKLRFFLQSAGYLSQVDVCGRSQRLGPVPGVPEQSLECHAFAGQPNQRAHPVDVRGTQRRLPAVVRFSQNVGNHFLHQPDGGVQSPPGCSLSKIRRYSCGVLARLRKRFGTVAERLHSRKRLNYESSPMWALGTVIGVTRLKLVSGVEGGFGREDCCLAGSLGEVKGNKRCAGGAAGAVIIGERRPDGCRASGLRPL